MTTQPEVERLCPFSTWTIWSRTWTATRVEYQSASPYPHIVIDNFLEPEAAQAAIAEFPPFDPERWNNYLHVNERKFSNTDPDTWGPTLKQILRGSELPALCPVRRQPSRGG